MTAYRGGRRSEGEKRDDVGKERDSCKLNDVMAKRER